MQKSLSLKKRISILVAVQLFIVVINSILFPFYAKMLYGKLWSMFWYLPMSVVAVVSSFTVEKLLKTDSKIEKIFANIFFPPLMACFGFYLILQIAGLFYPDVIKNQLTFVHMIWGKLLFPFILPNLAVGYIVGYHSLKRGGTSRLYTVEVGLLISSFLLFIGLKSIMAIWKIISCGGIISV